MGVRVCVCQCVCVCVQSCQKYLHMPIRRTRHSRKFKFELLTQLNEGEAQICLSFCLFLSLCLLLSLAPTLCISTSLPLSLVCSKNRQSQSKLHWEKA